MSHLLREILYMLIAFAAVVAGLSFGAWLLERRKEKQK